jgi:hypothetical protein
MSQNQALYAELFRVGSRGGGRFPAPGDLFESVIEDIYEKILATGDLALDGGAHVGRHSFPMAECVGRSGLVLAIEAHPRLAHEFVRRARKRGLAQVELVAAALSHRVGRVPFRPLRSLRFVKLDLEGGEFLALEGGVATLKTHRPLIVFENDQDRSAGNYGYSKEEWFRFFDGIGYTLFTLWGQPYGPSDWGRRDIPWYFMAAAAGSADADFVRRGLPALLMAYQSLL